MQLLAQIKAAARRNRDIMDIVTVTVLIVHHITDTAMDAGIMVMITFGDVNLAETKGAEECNWNLL